MVTAVAHIESTSAFTNLLPSKDNFCLPKTLFHIKQVSGTFQLPWFFTTPIHVHGNWDCLVKWSARSHTGNLQLPQALHHLQFPPTHFLYFKTVWNSKCLLALPPNLAKVTLRSNSSLIRFQDTSSNLKINFSNQTW